MSNLLERAKQMPSSLNDACRTIDLMAEEIERLREQLASAGWQPIETAPKDRKIRVWSWGSERHAMWNKDEYAKKPRPFWSMTSLGPTLSREHQPKWWMPCATNPEASQTSA